MALSADACASAKRPCAHNPLTWLDLTIATIPKGRQQKSVTKMDHTK